MIVFEFAQDVNTENIHWGQAPVFGKGIGGKKEKHIACAREISAQINNLRK